MHETEMVAFTLSPSEQALGNGGSPNVASIQNNNIAELENIDFNGGPESARDGQLGETAQRLVIQDIMRDVDVHAVFPSFSEKLQFSNLRIEEKQNLVCDAQQLLNERRIVPKTKE